MERVLPILIASKIEGGYINILDPFRDVLISGRRRPRQLRDARSAKAIFYDLFYRRFIGRVRR
jgi:hypothetical protein